MNKPVLKKAMSLLIASLTFLGTGILVMADEHDEEQPEDVDIVETVFVQDEATAEADNEKDVNNGWRLLGNDWYYYDADGVMATGWKQINGKWYYFGASGEPNEGAMVTGWLQHNGKRYYFDKDGVMTTGWMLYHDDWFYFDEDGATVSGLKQIDGKWYGFFSDGAMA